MATAELTAAVEQLDRAASTAELVEATRAIAALQDTNAADALIKVLGFNNPAVASVATAGLISLGRPIVPKLLVSLDARNYGARAWVVKVLASLRDPRGLDLLEHAQGRHRPSVRRAATRGWRNLISISKPMERLFADAAMDCCWQAKTMNGWFGMPLLSDWSNVSTAQACSPSESPGPRAATARVISRGCQVVRLRATLALERLGAR